MTETTAEVVLMSGTLKGETRYDSPLSGVCPRAIVGRIGSVGVGNEGICRRLGDGSLGIERAGSGISYE